MCSNDVINLVSYSFNCSCVVSITGDSIYLIKCKMCSALLIFKTTMQVKAGQPIPRL